MPSSASTTAPGAFEPTAVGTYTLTFPGGDTLTVNAVLPPQAYDKMSYYERWTAALAQTLLQRGLVTTEELARKMAEVDGRT